MASGNIISTLKSMEITCNVAAVNAGSDYTLGNISTLTNGVVANMEKCKGLMLKRALGDTRIDGGAKISFAYNNELRYVPGLSQTNVVLIIDILY